MVKDKIIKTWGFNKEITNRVTTNRIKVIKTPFNNLNKIIISKICHPEILIIPMLVTTKETEDHQAVKKFNKQEILCNY